ncbi:hypothetical protein HK100_003086 [Physocladia obscura]|uniref:C2H2-type domain-containing protein n=1 Tax=Physocladia obscura TaxID=109957 RepID=A0AAD5SUK5_9FUNG|nr:hypothetical protein HK100_003086 [Physocladia obscura]
MPGLSTPASDSSCKYYSDVLSNAANSHTPSATASSTPSASTAPSPIMTHISHPQQQFYPYSPLAPPYTLPIFQLPLPFLIRRRIELKHCVVRHESGVKPFYKCPSALCLARPKYKTPGGLKYHLTEEHSETAGGNNEFPFGWYWDDVSAAVARVAGEEDRYVCSIEGCKKRYTAMSGLRYHRKIAHLEAKE